MTIGLWSCFGDWRLEVVAGRWGKMGDIEDTFVTMCPQEEPLPQERPCVQGKWELPSSVWGPLLAVGQLQKPSVCITFPERKWAERSVWKKAFSGPRKVVNLDPFLTQFPPPQQPCWTQPKEFYVTNSLFFYLVDKNSYWPLKFAVIFPTSKRPCYWWWAVRGHLETGYEHGLDLLGRRSMLV